MRLTWKNVRRAFLYFSKLITFSTVYRVHWLKAKARKNRWNEEFILLASEMDWTVLYYRYQAAGWQRRADQVDMPENDRDGNHPDGMRDDFYEDGKVRGKICYAMKQKHMWHTMAEGAMIAFERAKRKVGLSG